MYNVRYAKQPDFRRLLKLSKTEWPDWSRRNPKYEVDYVEDRIKEGHTLVAVADGDIVGFLTFGSIWSRHWHIEDLYVQPKYRRLGIASALMRKLVSEAKKRGVRYLVTETSPENRAAHRYNKENGFRKAGTVEKLWGETDAVVFIKNVR